VKRPRGHLRLTNREGTALTAYEEYKSHLRRYAESVEELRKAVHWITAEKRLFPVMNDTNGWNCKTL
jgi:hypothetical protein